ncbi:MAG TPA: GH1 family beta-glucosidase [Terracidiphilus sp.]|nr:GH1 family beta-glucosidase [Terracidiphilus sp.]
MKAISRRQFGKTVAAAAALAGTSLPKFSFGQSAAHPVSRTFPQDFVWGCATAAYQIEGGATEGGRGRSVWDTFSHTPGKTHNGDTGDIADDSYHLYKEDVRLLKDLGVHGYRMSISWSRIFPEGKGQPNPAGLDYYNRVVDELLANNITPYVTLFHWDLPQALPGGWQSRDTSLAYAEYAGFIARHLSDRVHHFMTINEFTCFTDLGYRVGQFAPGLKLSNGEANQVRHHGVLAHGLGVQAIRANAKGAVQVGLAENAKVFAPVIEDDANIEAARRATRMENAAFLTTVMEGKYPDFYLESEGANAPKFEPADMKAIGSPLDFVGHNVYQPEYVRADGSPRGYRIEKLPDSYPHMYSPWITLGPEGIYWAVRNVCDLWHPKAMYITENGCSSDDVVTPEGRIEDIDRLMFLRNYLTHLQRATAEGYPVKGYFLWSLLDNFEWADGYSKRFGIHYVDFQTEKRTPKLSAEWYKQVIARNEVV